METKVRPNIDQALCNHARILMAGGAATGMAAELLGIGKSTVQKTRQAGFDAEKYQQMKQAEKEKTEQKKELIAEIKDPKEWKRWPKPAEQPAEEQVPGQICMDLKQKEPEEQGKAYRFQAAMVDRIVMEMDKINDTLSMLLRAMRKE